MKPIVGLGILDLIGMEGPLLSDLRKPHRPLWYPIWSPDQIREQCQRALELPLHQLPLQPSQGVRVCFFAYIFEISILLFKLWEHGCECMSLCLYVHMCTCECMFTCSHAEARAIGFWVICWCEKHDMGARNQTQVLWKNSVCF